MRRSVIGFSVLNTVSSLAKEVYNPKAFILHAASLGQAFAHCRRFSTAATRRCLGSVSVPMLGIMLSHPLPVIALVSLYLTNKLIGHRPLLKHPDLRRGFTPKRTISHYSSFRRIIRDSRVRSYALLTRLPRHTIQLSFEDFSILFRNCAYALLLSFRLFSRFFASSSDAYAS